MVICFVDPSAFPHSWVWLLSCSRVAFFNCHRDCSQCLCFHKDLTGCLEDEIGL